MEKFKVIIVEDVPLELKGTEGILRNDIPEAEIIGTAASGQSGLTALISHERKRTRPWAVTSRKTARP